MVSYLRNISLGAFFEAGVASFFMFTHFAVLEAFSFLNVLIKKKVEFDL